MLGPDVPCCQTGMGRQKSRAWGPQPWRPRRAQAGSCVPEGRGTAAGASAAGLCRCTEKQVSGAGHLYGEAELEAWLPSAAQPDGEVSGCPGRVLGTSWLPTSLLGAQPGGDEPQVHVPNAGELSRIAVPAATNPRSLGCGESSVPKRLSFTRVGAVLYLSQGTGLLCPPVLPRCPSAALLSLGDLGEGGAVQPGRWQNPHLPFM